MHPAYVPLEAEAETAKGRGSGDHRPGSGFFGNGEDAREHAVHHLVDLLQQADGRQVFAAAITVGNPLPLPAGIVQIEHRSDRIHPQAVQMILVQPEQGVRDQEGAYLVAAKDNYR